MLWKPQIRYISAWVDYVLSIPCYGSYMLCAYWKLNGFWKHIFEVWLYWLFILNGWSLCINLLVHTSTWYFNRCEWLEYKKIQRTPRASRTTSYKEKHRGSIFSLLIHSNIHCWVSCSLLEEHHIICSLFLVWTCCLVRILNKKTNGLILFEDFTTSYGKCILVVVPS